MPLANAMRFQCVPLPVEFELHELGALDLIAKLAASPLDRSWLTQCQIAVPLRPHDVVVRLLQRHEQREVIQPC